MMLTIQRKIQGATLLIVSCMVIATGCTHNAKNQVRQQGVPQGTVAPIRQNQYQPSAGDNRIQIAKQAADKITQVPGVKSANVLVTNRNAYVAAVVNTPQTELTKDLENQIAQQVKATDANIQNVYVSSNPEFVDRVNSYITDVGQGRPASGFVEQFSEMVRRIFPSAR
ncbi:YhcN/YlaJ family sporulation lipoprotein [Paenibacillus sp. WC2504]|uniref:YhcN/YlaJ family sporulation lipoprotein n=1 Tax=Paenibacillus sp. WC2504 TaxID=3461403 RepID=UPI00404678C6